VNNPVSEDHTIIASEDTPEQPQPPADERSANSKTRLKIIRILVLLFVIGLSAFLFLIREQISHLQGYGYAGIFLMSILANATIIVPLPGIFLTSAMGAVFHPFWVAVAAGLGAALGELSGYMAGFSGQGIIERTRWSDQLESWMRRYGNITILVLSFIPNPLVDMAGMTAGALKLPVHRFLIWSAIGKILKMMMFAYGGAAILDALPF
jgi:uncharacterized membrane protein YdjX (TVP38/TMEM64 family)